MRFRTGFVVGGIVGYLAGKEMAKRTMTPSDQRSPVVRAAMDRHPSTRFQGLTDRASAVGLEAVRRARATIQKRLVADVDDLSMN
jgi:hypothetical protein